MQLHTSAYRSALLVLVGLVVLVVIGVVLLIARPDFPFMSYVGGISTLAVALLTVAYVLTTSGQLSVMNEQLEQMRRSKDFQAQPLPVARVMKIEIEKPRFFYSPPEDKYSAICRVFVYFRIQNEGTHPAINVVASGKLFLSDKRHFDSASVLAEVIPESSAYPSVTETVDFMFTGDEKLELIDSLRRRDTRQQPFLGIRIVFRNALGSSFSATSYFQLAIPDAASDAKLAAWHSALAALPVRYKTEIQELKRLRNKNDSEWEALFDSVKQALEEQITDKSNLAILHFAIPLSFEVAPLSEAAYEREVNGKNFGSVIPHWLAECAYVEDG